MKIPTLNLEEPYFQSSWEINFRGFGRLARHSARYGPGWPRQRVLSAEESSGATLGLATARAEPPGGASPWL